MTGKQAPAEIEVTKLQSELSTVKGKLSRTEAELLEVRGKHEEDMKSKSNNTNSLISVLKEQLKTPKWGTRK